MQSGNQVSDKPQFLPLKKKEKKKKEKGFEIYYSDRIAKLKRRAAKSLQKRIRKERRIEVYRSETVEKINRQISKEKGSFNEKPKLEVQNGKKPTRSAVKTFENEKR
jgi:hypothetical protein